MQKSFFANTVKHTVFDGARLCIFTMRCEKKTSCFVETVRFFEAIIRAKWNHNIAQNTKTRLCPNKNKMEILKQESPSTSDFTVITGAQVRPSIATVSENSG